MPLSDAACRNARPRETPYKKSDGEGLYLLVQPNGSKLWRLNYRFDQKQKTLALGAYPAATLVEARAKRTTAKALLSKGIDPKPALLGTSLDLTFESIAREWHTANFDEWSLEHAESVLRRLENNVFPYIGSRNPDDVTPADVLSVVRRIEAREAIDLAKRMRQFIARIYRLAIVGGKARHNPASDVGEAMKKKPRVRHHPKLSQGQLPDFFRRLAAYDGEVSTRLGLKFVAHTFVRTKEIRFAQWPEFEEDFWRIPPERMKMHREHLVPLTPMVKGILADLKELAGNSRWVLPGVKGKPISGNTLLFALYRLGYQGRATVHGLRGTASTVLNESGRFNEDWIEMQLAHDEEDDVRGAYNSAEYLTQRVDMMHWYSEFLNEAERKGMPNDLADLLG